VAEGSLSLSVALCFFSGFKKVVVNSQPPYPPYPPIQHKHSWTAGSPIPKPIVMLLYPGTSYTVTHLRCYEIASLADVASATDWDRCVAPGCPFPNGWAADLKIRVSWSDNGAGGQFGTLDEDGNFVPLDPVINAQQITHYRASPNNPGIVHITLEVNDAGLYYNDEPSVVNDADNGNVTVWEFWITPCPKDWRPVPSTVGPSFLAWVEPATDHLGQSMSGFITFDLISSTEPGECLNSHFSCPYDIDVIDEFVVNGIHDYDLDLQFPPELEGMDIYGVQEEDEDGPYQHNFYAAVTRYPAIAAGVYVLCFDGGAYGFLSAHIYGFPPGSATARRIDTGIIEPVQIPYDANLNFIADAWEEAVGLIKPWEPPVDPLDYFVDPLGDFDDRPIGDGTPGDGLSVYEEYRGLRVRYQWTPFDPFVKDMFVMNFGAVPPTDPRWPFNFVIPNEAITSDDGFPGQGMPNLWLLNAYEGSGYPLRVVNFLNNYAHNRDVYAAIVIPDPNNTDNPQEGEDPNNVNTLAQTYGPIWGDLQALNLFGSPYGAPVVDVYYNTISVAAQQRGIGVEVVMTCVIAHELGHTVLWDVPDRGHHQIVNSNDCFMPPFLPLPPLPTEFCGVQAPPLPNCQRLWKLNP